MDIKDLINKYENLSKELEGLGTEGVVNNFLADLRKLQSENGKLPIPHVSDTVCCRRCGTSILEDEKGYICNKCDLNE